MLCVCLGDKIVPRGPFGDKIDPGGPGPPVWQKLTPLLAIGSYNWFPVGDSYKGCFVPFNADNKNRLLIAVGSAAFVLLAMRILVFNYEKIPQESM